MQPGLFHDPPQRAIEHPTAGLRYVPHFLEAARAQALFDTLTAAVPWRSSQRPMYDRIVEVPRLVASYALDAGDLPHTLRTVASELTALLDTPFNAAGLNLYRDGRDSVAPHNDTLTDLVAPHPIALLSLGATRRMVVRAKSPPRRALHLDLAAGSLLVMSHASQLTHEHGVPKTGDEVGPRISVALRVRRAPLSR